MIRMIYNCNKCALPHYGNITLNSTQLTVRLSNILHAWKHFDWDITTERYLFQQICPGHALGPIYKECPTYVGESACLLERDGPWEMNMTMGGLNLLGGCMKHPCFPIEPRSCWQFLSYNDCDSLLCWSSLMFSCLCFHFHWQCLEILYLLAYFSKRVDSITQIYRMVRGHKTTFWIALKGAKK